MLIFFNSAAPYYENVAYLALVYSFYGGLNVLPFEEKIPKINQILVRYIKSSLQLKGGTVLDAACGTGIFTRSIAPYVEHVIGIDLAENMVEKAHSLLKEHKNNNITFARAKVEKLPFKDNFFDGVSCCGAMQLFTDLNISLIEINRVLKRRSIFTGFTYIKNKCSGDDHLRNFIETRNIHFFEVEELEYYFKENGFIDFEYEFLGSIILFSAHKL
jgi:SAM-dependent methyltransferase